MSAWPTSPIPTVNLDQGSDSPAAARPDLLQGMLAINTIIGARGNNSGVAPLDAGGKLPVQHLPITPAFNGVQAWFSPGVYTWTAGPGVTRIKVKAIGAGGAGGYSGTGNTAPYKYGGGGGAGGTSERVCTVTPGTVVTITLGAPGTGRPVAAGGSDGGDGATTTISLTDTIDGPISVVGLGGAGGKAVASLALGGAGGGASGGTVQLLGGSGADGGEASGGIGGSSSAMGSAFTTGAAFPAGGGGGGKGGGGPQPSAFGAHGLAVIEW